MTRRRFFIPQDSIRDGMAILPADQAHHLRHVLRIRNGEAVEIFDGKGCGYVGEVELRGSGVCIQGLQSLPVRESSLRLILAAALIKSAKFEWMLQKATELGVDEIVPLSTRFSDLLLPSGKIASRLDRWDRIVKEASKQSRRFTAPQIHAPLQFADFLAAESFSPYIKYLLYEKAQELWQPNAEMLSNGIVICIGPEGGWDSGEIGQAKDAGCQVFGLGSRILRAETAAIAALAIVQHRLGFPV
jgi:16S rRNA (uracil1498-N3)-methyltransferase